MFPLSRGAEGKSGGNEAVASQLLAARERNCVLTSYKLRTLGSQLNRSAKGRFRLFLLFLFLKRKRRKSRIFKNNLHNKDLRFKKRRSLLCRVYSHTSD